MDINPFWSNFENEWTTCGWLGSSEAEGLFLDKKGLKVFNRLISMHCVVEEPDGGGKR
jgi:hypothetical protein